MAKASKSKLGERLIVAATGGDTEAMQAALDDGADVDFRVRADNDSTVLGYAVYEASCKRLSLPVLRRVLGVLLGRGMKADLANGDGTTALASIIEFDADGTMTARLLEHGANPNLADDAGLTPLMVAAQAGRLESARHLLAAGAERDRQNELGKTALAIAREARKPKLVGLLTRGARSRR